MVPRRTIGRGEPPLLPSTVRTYVPLLYALILRQGMPLCQPSDWLAPLTQISALPIQRVVPSLQPIAMRATPPPPPLSVSLQGIGTPLILTSAVRD